MEIQQADGRQPLKIWKMRDDARQLGVEKLCRPDQKIKKPKYILLFWVGRLGYRVIEL